jgi:hypothetical protein
LWRIVENQEEAATRHITASQAQQSRLEELLDQHKPCYLPGSEHLHWLLKTPFRYPPLRHGSRFGGASSPGIFYGSRELQAAQTETAVYLWLFRAGPITTGALHTLRLVRTAFQVAVEHARGVDLTEAGTVHEQVRICDPGSYAYTQPLGAQLREAAVGVVWYTSARYPGGTNGAVLDPAALSHQPQLVLQHWRVHLDQGSCWWGHSQQADYEIPFAAVSVGGLIPHPQI